MHLLIQDKLAQSNPVSDPTRRRSNAVKLNTLNTSE